MQGDYLDEVFGPQGALHRRFPGYQARQGQIDTARAVDAALRSQGHLLAEAGTGTGKTLAYAVPAIWHVLQGRQQGDERSAVLVTANIALQEQLVKKDLPLLAEILPWSFEYALLKGKSNYLCLDRFEGGAPGRLDPEDVDMHAQILDWVAETVQTGGEGDVSELPFEPPARLWGRFSVSSDDCAGTDCEHYDKCYSEEARRRAKAAHVVVTNYHLLFADMQVRRATKGSVSILPRYRIAILDEGHKAADIARDFFGWRVTEGAVRWVGGMLPNDEALGLERAQQAFFSSLRAYRRSPAYKARVKQQECVDARPIEEALTKARAAYGDLLSLVFDGREYDALTTDERKRVGKLSSRRRRALEMQQQIAEVMRLYPLPRLPWREHPDVPPGDTPQTRWYWSDPAAGGDNAVKSEAQLAVAEDVYFIEEEQGGRVALCAKPLSVAERLRQELFSPEVDNEGRVGAGLGVAVTSATLVAKGSFDYVAGELGVQRPATLVAQSPFAWREQALLVLPPNVPEPNHPAFINFAAERCAETIELARGRTLALFTSYRNLNAAHERAQAAGARLGYRILRQGDMPRTKLIDEFRRDASSVLLGTESFWAGVDVPGESLSCVFMDRLPFTTPEDPILDALTERDRDWFVRHSIPHAIIAFKQGFGRLIRSTSDRGAVVLLDKRVTTKWYGKFFLAALPPVERSSNLGDVRRWLDREPIVRVPETGAATGAPTAAQAMSQGPRSLFDQ